MDRVITMTYPTNEVVTQTYNIAAPRRVAQMRSATHNVAYASGLTYNPPGQLTQMRLGNNLLITNTYDLLSFRRKRLQAGSLLDLSYRYDAVGNVQAITARISGTQRMTYTQAWDAENRLSVVTNTVTGLVTRFYYDGDPLRFAARAGGKRVKKTEGATSTVYVGAMYEKNVTTGVTTTYYYAGSTRVAMRQAGVVSYLHGDHLGSASLTTNSSGGKVGELRYCEAPRSEAEWASRMARRAIAKHPRA